MDQGTFGILACAKFKKTVSTE